MVQKFLAASVQPSAIGLFVSKKSKVERTGTSGLEGNFKLQNSNLKLSTFRLIS